ncbi:hypothetical protein [Sediminitomix flava]|uniref:Uncharacterized protein n=1 Tax=Sediminitomix flava TaxID=379075 RepID=A0A315Z0B0_SEDFL|nr:hypothetical protein [Sediminitomix flava]PWJ36107.1 hypothetical protein BC781_109123 [Sediminitomix flava]
MYDEAQELPLVWNKLLDYVQTSMGKRPDVQGMLFLVGVQELGRGNQFFSKEEKQDLMHIAICKVLSFSGYYELEFVDQDGWPHWKNIKKLPFLNILSQETLLKMHIIEYFRQEVLGDDFEQEIGYYPNEL